MIFEDARKITEIINFLFFGIVLRNRIIRTAFRLKRAAKVNNFSENHL